MLTNGQADREKYWARAKTTLGCGSGTGAVTCTAEGMTGQCIATTSCTGKSVAGLCPGASNIQCCIPSGPSCTVNGRAGTCRDKATCAGTAYSGYCPGAANIQCCISN